MQNAQKFTSGTCANCTSIPYIVFANLYIVLDIMHIVQYAQYGHGFIVKKRPVLRKTILGIKYRLTHKTRIWGIYVRLKGI